MKVKDYLGVPDNLRAIDREDQMEKQVLKRDRDSVNDRKGQIVRLCDSPTGASSKELAGILGYSNPTAIVPMLRDLIKKHRIYRDRFRYYKVQPAAKQAPVDQPAPEQPKAPDFIMVTNEDKLIKLVEDMAKDFIWQADSVKVSQIKRFVDYIKANRKG